MGETSPVGIATVGVAIGHTLVLFSILAVNGTSDQLTAALVTTAIGLPLAALAYTIHLDEMAITNVTPPQYLVGTYVLAMSLSQALLGFSVFFLIAHVNTEIAFLSLMVFIAVLIPSLLGLRNVTSQLRTQNEKPEGQADLPRQSVEE